MNTRKSTIPQTQISQIPIGFNAYAKQVLQEELREMSYPLNPDTIYVNVERDQEILSETLTDTLLKKSTHREILLDDELAGLYSQPTDIQEAQQIEGLDITSVKRCIDSLSTTLVHSYLQQITSFWTKENLSIPQELQDKLDDTFLKDLINHSAIVDKVDQINSAFPNLRQSIIFYLSSKLQSVFAINIDPHVVHIDIFSQSESKEILFSFDLIDFTLYCFSSHFRSLYLLTTDNPLIQVRSNQSISNLKVHVILQAADIAAIKSTHRRKLNAFWQGYSDSYRLLVKFAYLQALFYAAKWRV